MVSVRITDIRHKKLAEGKAGITNANEMFLFVHGKNVRVMMDGAP